MASLRELQQAFAASLREPAATAPVRPVANLEIYRHNAQWQFHNALSLSFPVVRRRVGEDYFRELASLYRRRHPSRSGDLHWVGREFPGFLAQHLAGGDYAWLADLARLEWVRELASVAPVLPSIGADVLSRFAPEDLEDLVFAFQPSLNLVESPFPIFSVWLANQSETAPPVDQSLGAERCMVLSRNDAVEVARLTPELFSYLSVLMAGAPLGDALGADGLDESALLSGLQFQFSQGLVCGVDLAPHSAKR